MTGEDRSLFICGLPNPNDVRRLVILEMPLPGIALAQVNITPGGGLWWISFHLVPSLPEKLVAGKERLYSHGSTIMLLIRLRLMRLMLLSMSSIILLQAECVQGSNIIELSLMIQVRTRNTPRLNLLCQYWHLEVTTVRYQLWLTMFVRRSSKLKSLNSRRAARLSNKNA